MSKYFDDVMRGLRALDKSQLQEVKDKVEEYIDAIIEDEKREEYKWKLNLFCNIIICQ